MERKSFLLRLDPATMAALRTWAADDLRSLNGQIEYLLRRTLREAGRLPRPAGDDEPPEDTASDKQAAQLPRAEGRVAAGVAGGRR